MALQRSAGNAAVARWAAGGFRTGGRPLESDVRADMEARLGGDFRRVRVHEDGRGIGGAVAGAAGDTITFRPGGYRPRAPYGRWVLAHELGHVVQQSRGGPATAASETLEAESHRGAWAVTRGGRARGTFSPAPPGPRFLTEAEFRRQLGSTPEQIDAIDTLFANRAFADIWAWMGACTATPRRDHGPLGLQVTPNLGAPGVQRFGQFSAGVLEVNPNHPEHVANPAELVDTIVHEVLHAVHALRGACQSAGSPAPPIGASADSGVPRPRSASPNAAETARRNRELGPSASDPCNEFIDINAAAQGLVTSIITDVIQTARVGRPTVTFVNMIIRDNPAAMTFYENCRVAACARTDPAARTAAVADCSREVMGRFMPPALQRSLLPAFVYFTFDSAAIRAVDVETLRLVALFLVNHPTTTVGVTGHADTTGNATYNLGLGLRRAQAVRNALVARGVPSGQIRTPESKGEDVPRGATADKLWRDRTVVIAP